MQAQCAICLRNCRSSKAAQKRRSGPLKIVFHRRASSSDEFLSNDWDMIMFGSTRESCHLNDCHPVQIPTLKYIKWTDDSRPSADDGQKHFGQNHPRLPLFEQWFFNKNVAYDADEARDRGEINEGRRAFDRRESTNEETAFEAQKNSYWVSTGLT